jgi:hypothetical protein
LAKQRRGEERRVEERGELAKKATSAEQTAATYLEDPCRSTKQQLLIYICSLRTNIVTSIVEYRGVGVVE